MSGRYIDGHCHWSLYSLEADFFEESNRADVHGFFLGGFEPGEWARQFELAERHPEQLWFHSFGLHPWWVAERGEAECQAGIKLLKERASVVSAIGECGLDFSARFPKSSWLRQERYFIQQIRLSIKLQKPLVMHLVKAHAKAVEILQKENLSLHPGLLHAFSGTREQARFFIERGWLLSVGAGVTKPGYRKLKEAIPFIPLENMVIETDSCEHNSGFRDQKKRAYADFISLQEVAEAVANFRNESAEELLQASTQNVKRLLVKKIKE